MTWLIIIGAIAFFGIGICKHLAGTEGSTGAWTQGEGWSGMEFASSSDDDWLVSSPFDDNDDIYHSPIYSHLPCNVHYDMFSSDDDWSSSSDDNLFSSSTSVFDDDDMYSSSTSMFDDGGIGCGTSMFDDDCSSFSDDWSSSSSWDD